MSKICMGLAIFSCAILGVTTFDAATYFLSVQASGGKTDPNPMLKLLLGALLGTVAVTFMVIGDFFGLRGLGACAGIPVVLSLPLFAWSLVKMCMDIHDKKW